MGGKSAPDTPDTMDYITLSTIQSDLNKRNLEEQLQANRPTQITPWGTTTWEQDGTDWTQTVTLPYRLQETLKQQKELGLQRSRLANELLGDVGGQLTAPYGWDPLTANEVGTAETARDAAEEAIYGRATSRLDPYWEQQTEARETQLWNQGLRPGDEAWDTAMGNLGRARTDAYQAAMNEAIMGGGREAERMFGMDMARRQQAVSEALRQRTQGLNELNTLISGAGITSPQFPTFSRGGVAQTPDLVGAQQLAYQADLDQYNAQQARNQGLWSGAGGLVSTFAPMVPWGDIGTGVWDLFF